MGQLAYEVHLEMFEGPLDLLMYLIKKDDLDIKNIPISQITREYLGYLELMKELNLEVAGDFLVMASTLIQIKARTLLPAPPSLAEGEEGPDPRNELVEKLLEYQRFKEAAKFLDTRAAEWDGVFYRGAPRFAEKEKSLNIRIFDLLGTLREILDRAEDSGRVVEPEEFRIEEKTLRILSMLEDQPYVLFRDIFKGERRKLGIMTCFMALLELIKTQKVFARQEASFAEILIYLKREPPEVVGPIWPGSEEPVPSPAEGPEASAPAPDAAAAEPAVGRVEEPAPEGFAPAPATTPAVEQDFERTPSALQDEPKGSGEGAAPEDATPPPTPAPDASGDASDGEDSLQG
ncbi:MAG: segregation/condensation protein A [Elusimicrobiota bacterium]|jgi:segregation and condensation protein A